MIRKCLNAESQRLVGEIFGNFAQQTDKTKNPGGTEKYKEY